MKLTKNEMKVLDQLQDNCRESRNIIAKSCNLSRSGVDKTINKLLEKQIFEFKTIVDYTKLGMIYSKILINISNLNFDKTKIIKSIQNLKIVSVFLLEGSWDIEIIVAFSDVQHLQNEVLKLKEIYGEDIEEIKIIIVSEIFYDFPLKNKNNIQLMNRNEINPILKDSHLKLIKALIKDPLKPLYNLDFISFEKAKKDLEELKEIVKFSIIIDYEKVFLIQRKYFISFKNFKNYDNCILFIKSQSPVFFSKIVGNFDIECDIVFKSHSEEMTFINKLKEYNLKELIILKSKFYLIDNLIS